MGRSVLLTIEQGSGKMGQFFGPSKLLLRCDMSIVLFGKRTHCNCSDKNVQYTYTICGIFVYFFYSSWWAWGCSHVRPVVNRLLADAWKKFRSQCNHVATNY